MLYFFSEFNNDGCATEFENVKDVTIEKYGECVSLDVEDIMGDSDYAGLFSMKIEDCGQNVYYYSDDNCQNHVVAMDDSWTSEEDFTCQSEQVDSSSQTFCPATSSSRAGPKGKEKGKGRKAPRHGTFATQISLAVESARAGAFNQQQDTQAASPVQLVVLGSFVGMVVGVVAVAKFFKSRNQFEGVEMRSSHSSLE